MADLHQQLLDWINTAERAVAEDSYPTGILLAAALRAVVELHGPQTSRFEDEPTECAACSPGDRYSTVAYPCSTVRAIAEQLGVETE